MDAGTQLKQDVRAGRLDAVRLVELVLSSRREAQRAQQPLQQAQQQLQEPRQRIEEWKRKLGGSATVKTADAYSMRTAESWQHARGNQPRKNKKLDQRSRLTTAQ